jgi:hypothetical protein
MKILFVLLLTTAAFAQDHAPTSEQCKADVALWLDKSLDQTDTLTYIEIDKRKHEMIDCHAVLTAPGEKQLADDGSTKASLLEQKREEDFIHRHDLAKQFLAEDQAGQR